MLIRSAEVAGENRDVRLTSGRIETIAPTLSAQQGERLIDAKGGALIPGLTDHHLHVQALAAALESVPCGPPKVEDSDDLVRALSAAEPTSGWLRGTGYFESVAGELDRDRLDAIRSDVPLRIQHRSGILWFCNSRALEALGLDGATRVDTGTETGVQRNAQGRATGRLFRADEWLRDRLPRKAPPDLARVGHLLASYGVTALTDCTPSNSAEDLEVLKNAQATGALPQRLEVMGSLELPSQGGSQDRLRTGAHKIMLDEPALPDFDKLVERITRAHRADRAVAFHTVTRAEIHFALAALDAAGTLRGDRLEHASVAPPEAVEIVQRLGIGIATQPNFIAERGDAYLENVDLKDQPHLYRVASWIEAGVPLAGGTDAPFGDPDPWRAMRAAVERRSPTGSLLGEAERVTPEVALRLFSDRALARSGREKHSQTAPAPRVGLPADLCLLDRPWKIVREDLSSDRVAATFMGGEAIYERPDPL